MMASKDKLDEWHVFSTIRSADGKTSYEIAAGTNSYCDGPDRTVGRISGFSEKDLRLLIAGPAMLNVLRKVECWLDLPEGDFQHMMPADAMSHREQLADIRAAIAKATGAA
ncbi:hypothetical protein K7W03_14275 [Sphingobium sp. PNB]|uniref:hypothetical protein n=1 Tax=Sphingobium sp. PNB TaxID=863934 RepID=UPI001CA39CF7|nr:hypothetical protein [Sphingobium sp. PNB]MCB4860758.1 hypothetical protein [Sphingobium sp. PNB]